MFDKIFDYAKDLRQQKSRYRDQKRRAKSLPRDYRIVYEEICKYMWQFASNDPGVLDMLGGTLELFEGAASEGKAVLDVVGDDVIAYCDGLLREISDQTWMGKIKSKMNRDIHEKLNKRSDEEEK